MKSHIRFTIFLIFTILIGAVLTSDAQRIGSGGRIRSDRTSFSQAHIVAAADKSGLTTLTGSGFLPYEAVALNVEYVAVPRFRNITVGHWIVFSDAAGAIETNWQMTDLAGNYVANAFGKRSAANAAAPFKGPAAVEAGAASLDQCANGTLGSEVICSGLAWENGNLNENKAHYFEGEAVAYRIQFTGISTTGGHWVILEWDTTENAKHAIDYLTSYDYSEANADPCSGSGPIRVCNSANISTWPMPTDDHVASGHDGVPGTIDDIVQDPGVFTMFDGVITGVSAYTRTGAYSGSSQTSIRIDFTATTSTPVLAWGGHISSRHDWGASNSAIAISGSPFHMRLLELDGSGGNQDRSLSSSAALFPAQITIIKNTRPNSGYPFTFTATGQPGLTSPFTLDDDGFPAIGYPNSQTFSHLALFGAANQVVVTESFQGTVYSLGDILCTSDPFGGAGTDNNTISITNQNVAIMLEEGEMVTCTFVNLVTGPTAAPASITGRVTTAFGRPIYRAAVTVMNTNTGDVKTIYTGSFGYYRFDELPTGDSYIVSVYAKRYRFELAAMLVNLTENVTDLNFIASP